MTRKSGARQTRNQRGLYAFHAADSNLRRRIYP
jgi:hypothetical protein